MPITNNAINNIVVRFFPHILSPAKTQKKNLLQLFVLSVCLFVCLFVCVLHKIGHTLTVLWSLPTAEVLENVLIHYTRGKREP